MLLRRHLMQCRRIGFRKDNILRIAALYSILLRSIISSYSTNCEYGAVRDSSRPGLISLAPLVRLQPPLPGQRKST